ncbi:MAG: peptide chain release factor N(5)-glutamine methyltransferase [Lachnospiraceae bacterium]|nr:peptide chain release factor N(5)-glutamine methyltransferase [Lachnospiraceae bacterium]MCD8250393.1 peptide chain release factor N(5)-glutamine methyltransferase [Lachnospiraceae bacterium]
MTLAQLLKTGEDRLQAAGISEWRTDAWLLLEFALSITRKDYLLEKGRPSTREEQTRYEALIEKRSLRVPLQHLTGCQEFMGLSFDVSPDVLVPRQDTEILVEECLRSVRPSMRVLDLCTGSGCILLSILKLAEGVKGVGTDLSERALDLARKNGKRLGMEAAWLQSDLFERVEGRFDRIVSNPPYIPTEVIGTLEPEVREHEPYEALDGGADGLDFYRKITEQSPHCLRESGMLFMEIGYDQADAVRALMEKYFMDIRVVKDLAGLDRVIYGTVRA